MSYSPLAAVLPRHWPEGPVDENESEGGQRWGRGLQGAGGVWTSHVREKVRVRAQLVDIEPVLLAIGQTAPDERLQDRTEGLQDSTDGGLFVLQSNSLTCWTTIQTSEHHYTFSSFNWSTHTDQRMLMHLLVKVSEAQRHLGGGGVILKGQLDGEFSLPIVW